MTWQSPESDPEEDVRVRRALVMGARGKLEALRDAPGLGSYLRDFVRRDPASFDLVDFELLRRIAWHYRAHLPHAVRICLTPDDPIVREMETAHG